MEDLINEKLKPYYTDQVTKEDYEDFFIWFDSQIVSTENWKKTSYDYMIYNAHKHRSEFKTVTINKKRKYKLDIMLNNLVVSRVINYNPENHNQGRAREYYYNPLFIDMIEVTKEEKLKNIDITDYKNLRSLARQRPGCRLGRDIFNVLRSDNFTIDQDAAHEWIITKYDKKEITLYKAKLYFMMVNDIYYNNIFVKVGKKSNRVFTNFTCMKKELRQFCRLNGKSLMSIDMKSSVPYIFASYLFKTNQDVKEIKEFYDIVTEGDIYKWIFNKLTDTDSLKYNKRVEVTKINEVSGKNYTTFENKEIVIENRDDVKGEFMSFMYSTKRGSHGFYHIFNDNFPTVLNILKSYKKELAKTLMTEESDIFIPVCRANKEKALSVHDSLYFAEDDYVEIKKALEERLAKKGYHGYELTEEK